MPISPDPNEVAPWERFRLRAQELGFDLCRFTTAGPPETGPRYLSALAEGRHGEMAWLARRPERRLDPQLVLPGARTLIALATAYPGPDRTTKPDGKGVVAAYAQALDYHDALAPALRRLASLLDDLGGPASRSLWYTDTGPILERDLAQRAGVGFIGKHTNLISPRHGNWILLAEILTTVEWPPDRPEANRCGRCARCLDACPTGALPAPFTLDARRCIAYLTIELKGSIDPELRPLIGDRVFGCDDCLAACPWNRFARAGRLLAPSARPDLARLDLIELLALDERGFKARFGGTPLERTKRRGLRRNACVALGNIGNANATPALHRAASDPDSMVAEHAAWALDQITARVARRQTAAGSSTADFA